MTENENQFSRTAMLIGKDNLKKLQNAHVAVFGLGGVGSFVAEALARVGVGKLTIADSDIVSVSNINRQLIALHSTVGKDKTLVSAERIKDINPLCELNAVKIFVSPENIDEFTFKDFDYVVDAVDNITAKLLIIEKCKEFSVPIISCMGTGNKLDATKFAITDISKTSVCPLARVMRYELKKRGIKNVKVLFSTEPPLRNERPPASVSFVPSVAGLLIAGEVIKDIIR